MKKLLKYLQRTLACATRTNHIYLVVRRAPKDALGTKILLATYTQYDAIEYVNRINSMSNPKDDSRVWLTKVEIV